jgi:hypothetical protein
MDFEKIRKIIEENLEIVDSGVFGEGVSNDWIQKAQFRLGVVRVKNCLSHFALKPRGLLLLFYSKKK